MMLVVKREEKRCVLEILHQSVWFATVDVIVHVNLEYVRRKGHSEDLQPIHEPYDE